MAPSATCLKHRQQWAKRHAKNEYLLSGFLRCGFCNRRLFGHTIGPKKRKKALYSCAGLMKENRPYLVHPCDQKRLPLAWIEGVVWWDLSEWSLKHDNLESEIRALYDRQEHDRAEWQASSKRNEKKLGNPRRTNGYGCCTRSGRGCSRITILKSNSQS